MSSRGAKFVYFLQFELRLWNF